MKALLTIFSSLAILSSSLLGEETISRAKLFETLKKREDVSFLEGKKDRPYIHFIIGDDEYGAFFSMPMIAEILNKHHGFSVSLSYTLDDKGYIDSRIRDGLTGFDLLPHADMLIIYSRSKRLDEKQSKFVLDFYESDKPIMGFRCSNHGFNFKFSKETTAHVKKEHGNLLQAMLNHGHRGHHGGGFYEKELTNIFIPHNSTKKDHPILRGFTPYIDPRHLYFIDLKTKDKDFGATPLVYGSARKLSKGTQRSVQPTFIIKENDKGKRFIYSSTSGADTFAEEGCRKITVNGIFWALKMENEIPEDGLKVDFYRPYLVPYTTHLLKKDGSWGGVKKEIHRGKPKDVFKDIQP